MATSQPERITEYLLRDHQRLRALLERARAADPLDEEAFAAFRAGLLRHIAIEEKLLWPAARRARGDRPLEQARALRIEHAALGSLLVPTPDAALCDEIRSLLGAHDAREEGEGGVYTECEHLLSAAESAQLAERAASFRQIRAAPYYDGPAAHRTAASALAAARRITAE